MRSVAERQAGRLHHKIIKQRPATRLGQPRRNKRNSSNVWRSDPTSERHVTHQFYLCGGGLSVDSAGRNRREETTKETKDAKTTDANKKHLKFGRPYWEGAPKPIILSLTSHICFRVFRGLSFPLFNHPPKDEQAPDY